MAFEILDEDYTPPKKEKKEPKKNQSFIQQAGEFVKGLPEAGARLATVPAAKAGERLAGTLADWIETPSQLTQFVYSLLGKEPPEWTQGPVSFRLNEEGEPKFGLSTTEEIREKQPFGEYGEPRNQAERILGGLADIGSQVATGGIRNPRALAATTGTIGATREAGEQLGLPPAVTGTLEALAGHTAASRTNPPNALPLATERGLELAETAMHEGVTQAPAGILEAGRPSSWASFFRRWGTATEPVRERAAQFRQQIENAYHDVLGHLYEPYQTNRNLRQLRDAAGELFEPLRPMAQRNPNKIDLTRFNEVVDEQLANLRKNKNLDPRELEMEAVLQNTKHRIRESGGMNLEEAVDTFRGFNKTINWDDFQKSDFKARDIKEQLRRDIIQNGRDIPGFNELFNRSNATYTRLHDLFGASEIMRPAFAGGDFNLTEFSRVVRDPVNRELLRDVIGDQNFRRMRRIVDLSDEARRNFEAVGAMLPESQQAANNAVGATFRLTPTTAALAAGTFFGRNFAARILTSPNLQTNYLGYMRSIRDNAPRLTAYYLRRMSSELEKGKKEEKENFEVLPEDFNPGNT